MTTNPIRFYEFQAVHLNAGLPEGHVVTAESMWESDNAERAIRRERDSAMASEPYIPVRLRKAHLFHGGK